MRITGRGHAAVRGTHAKTLEFTPDEAITERATCVIATAAVVDPARPLAGPVRITVTAGVQQAVLHARANPEWDPAGPAVVRRGALRLPGTLATHADTSAADLPRELIAALRDPATRIRVDVDPLADDEPVVVLAAATAGPTALAAELAAADVVVAEDPAARAVVGHGDPAPHLLAGRVLVVAADDLPGASVPLAGARVETLGLAPRFAAAAACPSRAPVTFGTGPADLADVPAGHRLVLAADPDRLADLLERARTVRGTTLVTLAQPHTVPWPHRIGGPLAPAGRETVHCCFHPTAADLDPRVRAAVAALLGDGVATRTAARALAELTGWSRRRAYDAVLAVGADHD